MVSDVRWAVGCVWVRRAQDAVSLARLASDPDEPRLHSPPGVVRADGDEFEHIEVDPALQCLRK